MSIFKFKEFVIKHDNSAMKVGTDGVLLGSWASCLKSDSILDIGCGSGKVLYGIEKLNYKKIYGIEINEHYFENCKKNFINNNKIEVINQDFFEYNIGDIEFFYLYHPFDSNDMYEKLFNIFKELIIHTSGDFDEAIEWLRELDKEYKLTDENYTIDDFVNDLLNKGFVTKQINSSGDSIKISSKTERLLRKHVLKHLFGNLKKTKKGNHKTKYSSSGSDENLNIKNFEFGDPLDRILLTESLKNAIISSGENDLTLKKEDIVVWDSNHNSQMSTVLMIDISHSMILYGEDRITPAKKVAMALVEYIKTKFPKDTIDILSFGDEARPINIKDLPYLKVGPYHTNTVAGLDLAFDILRRKKNNNKQIFMITDGKPSCMFTKDGFYKNSAGLDDFILDQCYNRARQAKKNNIPITTFMIASDPYLQTFVKKFSEINNGKAFYTGLDGLSEMIFEDYDKNRRQKLR